MCLFSVALPLWTAHHGQLIGTPHKSAVTISKPLTWFVSQQIRVLRRHKVTHRFRSSPMWDNFLTLFLEPSLTSRRLEGSILPPDSFRRMIRRTARNELESRPTEDTFKFLAVLTQSPRDISLLCSDRLVADIVRVVLSEHPDLLMDLCLSSSQSRAHYLS